MTPLGTAKDASDPAPRFISYAQHGEDVILWRALGDREHVFYVDVGAFDPTFDSVTRALYERGWRGINIEPQTDRIEAFEQERPEDTNLGLAVGDHDGTAVLTCPEIAGWATTLAPAVTGFTAQSDRTVEVPMRRLDTLLAELGVEQVDILKVDVEGAEPAVVRGLLKGPVRPLVCVVEGVAPGVERAAGDEAVAMLMDAGYIHCLFDGLNHYLTIDPALRQTLSVPANPLDGHITASIAHLELERSRLHAAITALAAENLALRTAPAQTAELDTEPGTDSAAEPDTPLDTAETPDLVYTPAPQPPVLARQRTGLDPVVRTARRRATFVRLLQAEALSKPKPKPEDPSVSLLSLVSADPSPAEAVSTLYQAILGREVDAGGLAEWTTLIESGQPLLRVARALAKSGEARVRPPHLRSLVLSDLAVWESTAALTELGVAAWHPDRALSPGKVAHEIFVWALYEVAFQRRPSPDEASFEIAKLVGGTGREWLLRAFANQPAVRSRMLGNPAPGLRGRVRHWQDRCRHLANFRAYTAASEARQIAHYLASLSHAGPGLADLFDATPSTPEER